MVNQTKPKGKGAPMPPKQSHPALTYVNAEGCKKGLMHNSPFRDGISNVIPGGAVVINQVTGNTTIIATGTTYESGIVKVCDLDWYSSEGVSRIIDRKDILLRVLYEHPTNSALSLPLLVEPFVVFGPNGLTITNGWYNVTSPIDAVYAACSASDQIDIDWMAIQYCPPQSYPIWYWNGSAVVNDYRFAVQEMVLTLNLDKYQDKMQRLVEESQRLGHGGPVGALCLYAHHSANSANNQSLTINAHQIRLDHSRARKS